MIEIFQLCFILPMKIAPNLFYTYVISITDDVILKVNVHFIDVIFQKHDVILKFWAFFSFYKQQQSMPIMKSIQSVSVFWISNSSVFKIRFALKYLFCTFKDSSNDIILHNCIQIKISSSHVGKNSHRSPKCKVENKILDQK